MTTSEPVAPPPLGIVGPTASGKSDLALALARQIPVEILVADSRQVYRGMDVGTAKPDAAARAAVPHHLLDLVDPDEPFSVADWVARARGLLPQIEARGRTPLLVGGTGLYIAALASGHEYGGAAPDPELRSRLTDELARDGLDALAARLASVAPEVAARVDTHNPRRVVRAMERVEAGERVQATGYAGEVRLVALQRPRAVLNERIDRRAEWIFANGLLDEVRALLAAGYGPDPQPMTGHGYAEAMRHLAGEWSLDQAIEVTARRTRQYAKRQLTWFRHQVRVTWLDAGDREADDPHLVAAALDALGWGSGPHRLP